MTCLDAGLMGGIGDRQRKDVSIYAIAALMENLG